MQNNQSSQVQELNQAEVEQVSGGLFDDWWASNRDVCLPQRISKYDLMTAF